MDFFSRYNSTKSLSELGNEAKRRRKLFFQKTLRGAPERRLSDTQKLFLQQLAGTKGASAVLLGSDGRARYRLMRLIFLALRDLMRRDPNLEFLFVTIINDDWDTSDERTRIPLRPIQAQVRRILRPIATDWLGIVEMQVFSNVRHPSGGKRHSSHFHGVIWGYDIEDKARDIIDIVNNRVVASTPGCKAMDVERITPTILDLGRVVRYLLKLPDRCKNLYINEAKGKLTINQSEAGDRYVRYLRQFQLQSLLQLDHLLFGSGYGGRIRAECLRQAHDWREAKTGRRKRADVMTEIGMFWQCLMPSLGHGRFRVPEIS